MICLEWQKENINRSLPIGHLRVLFYSASISRRFYDCSLCRENQFSFILKLIRMNYHNNTFSLRFPLKDGLAEGNLEVV